MAAGRSACRFFSSSSRSPTVWGRNTNGTPPSVIVSPSFTGACSVTGVPLTAVPPLEPRSYTVQAPSSPRHSAACCREMLG